MIVRNVLTISAVICLVTASNPLATASPVNLVLTTTDVFGTQTIACPDNLFPPTVFCDYNPALDKNAYANARGTLTYSGTVVSTNFNGILASRIVFTGPPPVFAPASFLPDPSFGADGYIGNLGNAAFGSADVDILATHAQAVPQGLSLINRAQINAISVFFPFANSGNATITVTALATGCPTVALIANVVNPGPAGSLVTLPNLTVRGLCGIFQGTTLIEIGDLAVTVNDAVVFFPSSADVTVDIVPEPGTLFLFSTGIFTLIGYRRHHKAAR